MRDGLAPLQPEDREAVREVARLHGMLLPGSPIARLGRRFMERFYYRTLVADGLVQVLLYHVDGEAAGFIAQTPVPGRFMGEGLRRHWAALGALLAVDLITDPRRARTMLWTARHMLGQLGASVAPDEGELLSFGVLPEFRAPGFVRRTGRRIAVELFDAAVASLKGQGAGRIRAVVEANNREALMFYHGRGCRIRAGADLGPGRVVMDCIPHPSVAE